jgi:hypothetical protein
MIEGTYVSGDCCERAEAFQLGYRAVCQHPKEVGDVEPGGLLVIDFDHVLFGDRELAVRKASEAASRGAWVGVHTFTPDDTRLDEIRVLPDVIVAKTHRDLLDRLGGQGRAAA